MLRPRNPLGPLIRRQFNPRTGNFYWSVVSVRRNRWAKWELDERNRLNNLALRFCIKMNRRQRASNI